MLKDHSRKFLHLNNPFGLFIVTAALLLIMALLFLSGCTWASSTDFSKSRDFELADRAQNIPHQVLSRKNLASSEVSRIQIRVAVPGRPTRTDLQAVAQALVLSILREERVHSVSIDFGETGFVDYAPFGNWTLAGEVPIDDYRDYRFRYLFYGI